MVRALRKTTGRSTTRPTSHHRRRPRSLRLRGASLLMARLSILPVWEGMDETATNMSERDNLGRRRAGDASSGELQGLFIDALSCSRDLDDSGCQATHGLARHGEGGSGEPPSVRRREISAAIGTPHRAAGLEAGATAAASVPAISDSAGRESAASKLERRETKRRANLLVPTDLRSEHEEATGCGATRPARALEPRAPRRSPRRPPGARRGPGARLRWPSRTRRPGT